MMRPTMGNGLARNPLFRKQKPLSLARGLGYRRRMEHRIVDDSIARHNLVVLTIAQALLGAQMPMIFTIGGLAGAILAPNACLATLPISMIVFGSMTTSTWLSAFMQRFGRASSSPCVNCGSRAASQPVLARQLPAGKRNGYPFARQRGDHRRLIAQSVKSRLGLAADPAVGDRADRIRATAGRQAVARRTTLRPCASA